MDVDSDHTQLRLRQSPPGHSQVERPQNRARLDARLLLQQPRRMDHRRSRGHPSTCLILQLFRLLVNSQATNLIIKTSNAALRVWTGPVGPTASVACVRAGLALANMFTTFARFTEDSDNHSRITLVFSGLAAHSRTVCPLRKFRHESHTSGSPAFSNIRRRGTKGFRHWRTNV